MSKRAKKFEYLYVLQGNYSQGWEDLTAVIKSNEGWKEIKQARKDYVDNEGGSYRIVSRRELIKTK